MVLRANDSGNADGSSGINNVLPYVPDIETDNYTDTNAELLRLLDCEIENLANATFPNADFMCGWNGTFGGGPFWNGSMGGGPFFNISLGNDSYGILKNSTIANGTDGPAGPPHSLWLTIILALMAGSMSLITVLGNILVLVSFFCERAIRQPSNYFIASLAVSDLLIGFFSMPLYTLYLLKGSWPLGPVVCDLWLALDYTVCLTSQYTVFFITVDRFCSVKIPAKYRNWRTAQKINIMVAATWILPILVFYISIIGWQFFVGKRTVPDYMCYVQFMESPMFNTILVIGYYWITLFVMSCLYAGIYKVALNLHRKSARRQKKMTTLVSMAGQTMTKIGIGISRGPNNQDETTKEDTSSSDLKSPKKPKANNVNNVANSNSKGKHHHHHQNADDERSSSPAFASDTEPSSQSAHNTPAHPNPQNQDRLHASDNISVDIDTCSTPLHKDKQLGENGNDNGNGNSANGVSGLPPPPCYSSLSTNDAKIGNKDGSYSATSTLSPPGDNDLNRSPSSLDTAPNTPNHSMPSTPKNLRGIRYIDQDSFQSFTSNDEIKVMISQKKDAGSEPPSPIWKKRPITESAERLNGNGKQLSNEQSQQKGAWQNCNNVNTKVSIQVETVDDRPNGKTKTITKAVQPRSRSKTRNQKDDTIPVVQVESSQPVLQRFTNYFRFKKPKEKKVKDKKSKSENRAKKALRTITLILGAFVIFWTPYHIIVVVMGFCPKGCISDTVFNISYWLCYMNSPLNPLCYAFANAQFKRTFHRILKFDFHRT